ENINSITAVRYKDYDDPEIMPLNSYLLENGVKNLSLTHEIWNVVDKTMISIKDAANKFKRLKDYDIKINFGIKTGYNEAFIIDKLKYEELINQDLNNKEILRPILRGRDTR